VSGDDTDGDDGDGAGIAMRVCFGVRFLILRFFPQQNLLNQQRRRRTAQAIQTTEVFINKQFFLSRSDHHCTASCVYYFIVRSVTTRCNMSDISTTRELIESKPDDAHDAMMFMSAENCIFIVEISDIWAFCMGRSDQIFVA
jgi:hypothetical protein